MVTVDFWIGTEDRVPYQMLVKTANPAAGLSQEQNFIFSNWREIVEIAKPCEAC